MKKNSLLEENEIKEIINEALYNAELINDEIYEKCKPKILSGLPGDLRSNDEEEIHKRWDALLSKQEEAIRERNKNVEPKVKEHFDKGIKLNQDFITVTNIHAIRNRIDELAQSHEGKGNIRNMKGYSKLRTGSQKMEDYLYRQGGNDEFGDYFKWNSYTGSFTEPTHSYVPKKSSFNKIKSSVNKCFEGVTDLEQYIKVNNIKLSSGSRKILNDIKRLASSAYEEYPKFEKNFNKYRTEKENLNKYIEQENKKLDNNLNLIHDEIDIIREKLNS